MHAGRRYNLSASSSALALCYNNGMYPQSVFDRVAIHAAKFVGTDGCWEWPMSRTAAGYGQLTYRSNGRTHLAYAHRASYMAANGGLGDGLHVCHHCDNPCCFNPAHLFSGTARDNSRDMMAKGRGSIHRIAPRGERHWSKITPKRGSSNGNSKLTEGNVAEIRASSEKSIRLAERFGVSNALICNIRKGVVWRHVL